MLLAFLFLTSLVKGEFYSPKSDYSQDYDDPPNEPVKANCDDLSKHGTADTAISSVVSKYQYYGCEGSGNNHVNIKANIEDYGFLRCQIISQVTFLEGVTSIGVGAFSRCTNLKTISFPDRTGSGGVDIGEGAFYYCSSIDTPVSIPTFVVSIQSDSFAYTGKLTLNIADRSSNSVRALSLGNGAFYQSNLVVSTIPIRVSVGDSTFYLCPNIETINYHGDNIGNNAFQGCSKLKTFTFNTDSKIFSIGKSAFEDTILEGRLTFPDSLKLILDRAFYQTGISGDLNLNEVMSVGKSAFQGCSGLGTLTATKVVSFSDNAFRDTEISGNLVLPENFQLIGDYSFYKTKITGLRITSTSSSAGEPKIGEFAFAYCSTAFGSIHITDTITIDRYAFAGLTITNDVTIGYPSSYNTFTINSKAFIDTTIGKEVSLNSVKVSKDAFLNAKMNSLSIECRSNSDVVDISGNAFVNCQIESTIELTDVHLGDYAFKGLSKLTSPNVTFYHNNEYDHLTTEIGNGAFYETTITGVNSLLENVESIGRYAFYHCKNLKGDLILNASTIKNYAFTDCSYSNLTIGNLVGSLDLTYDGGSDSDSDYLGFQGCPLTNLIIERSDNEGKTFSIPSKTFYRMSEISNKLVIPSYVNQIGKEAFSGCSKLSGLEFEQYPSALTLDEKSFYGCSAIPNLNIARDVSIIPNYCFYKCTALSTVTFPETLNSINDYAFSQSGLTSLQFPDSLSLIGYGAFQDCSRLSTNNLVIPDQISSIPTRAFCRCPFTNVQLIVGKSLTTIGDYAFYQCKFNGNLNLPDVNQIGDYAFYECSGFTGPLVLYTDSLANTGDTSVPFTTLTIGKNAFQGCTGFSGQIPTNYITTLDENIFSDCKGFSGALDLQKFTEIPDYAFYNCENINSLILSDSLQTIGDYAFYGCLNLEGPIEFPSVKSIGKYAFAKCSKLNGPLKFEKSLTSIGDYAFQGCSGFSNSLSFDVNSLDIGEGAFKGCSGFNKGTLTFAMDRNSGTEEGANTGNNHYSYPYFLKIHNYAFEDAKFDDVYYLGRFEPDCDYESGIKNMKKVYTASNYVNSSFCRKTVRKNGLSGGAIAGIVIAVIVVVAVIAVLVFLLIKEKKKRDHSEGEVEMNES